MDVVVLTVFFFKQKTAYEMRISDWSSDVCSSDLEANAAKGDHLGVGRRCLPGQVQAVADEIGQILNDRILIIMGEDDGVTLLAQPVDLRAQVQPCEFAPEHVQPCRSEEHTSELQSLMRISFAVFCLTTKTTIQ